MRLDKYKWKCRLLVIYTPNYKNKIYLKTKGVYQREIKDFHKRSIKLITKLDRNGPFLSLIGFDGKLKKKFLDINHKIIFNMVDKMPMGGEVNNKKLKPLNLSLFSDYRPSTTTSGLGFKDKEKAICTIKAIKNRPIKYQINVISTMLGRAKNHPNKTKNMNEAIKVFNKWIKEYKSNNL